MSEGEETTKRKKGMGDAEEIRQVLGAVSTEVPGLIRSIIASVFSEEAGRSMGKAAAAFYKELKDSGMPESVAVKMTEDYIGVFTSLGDMLKMGGRGKMGVSAEQREDVATEIEKRIKENVEKRIKEKTEKREEEEEEE